MGQSTLNNAPPEIGKEILSYLPRADLPATRLVNKQLASLAAPRLFQKIPLWLSIKSLESLTHLSYHSSLRGYVEEIVFSPLRLIEHKDQSKYLQTVKTVVEVGSDSMSSVALQYGKQQSAYYSFIEAQRYLAEGRSSVLAQNLGYIKL